MPPGSRRLRVSPCSSRSTMAWCSMRSRRSEPAVPAVAASEILRKSCSTSALTAAGVVAFATAIALIGRPSATIWSSSSSAGVSPPSPVTGLHQRLDDLGVEHRPAGGDLAHGPGELVALGDPILQQVGVTGGAVAEERDDVFGVVELRQDDHAGAGVALAQLLGRVDALALERRGHADVGDQHLGLRLGRARDQLVVVGRRAHDLEVGLERQHRPHPLADDHAVVRQEDRDAPPFGHAAMWPQTAHSRKGAASTGPGGVTPPAAVCPHPWLAGGDSLASGPMRVRFYGVRGSTPAPGADFVRVGGNTSCVAVAHDTDAPVLVLDAGTGLRRLSEDLDGEAFRGTILLTHLHWDHVQGLPFFGAGDRADADVSLVMPAQGDAREVLARAMSPPHFPIGPDGLLGKWTFESIEPGEHTLEGFNVLAAEVPHKGGRTFGYRISDGDWTFAYVPDHEPSVEGPGPDGLGARHEAVLALAKGVDVLAHGAQYTLAERERAVAFGHATIDYAMALAREAGVGRLVLFHHEPGRTDNDVESIARSLDSAGLPVQAAVEGLELEV